MVQIVPDAAIPDPGTDDPPRWLLVVAVLSVLVGVIFRFTTQSPLWLDEALSVNVAALPLGDIPGALRRDGHPPLYYVLLHGWMDVFGSSDVAVRALAGVWSVALLPLAWFTARRLSGPTTALYAVILLALSPFAVRYGTETRMYAMVAVLALAGFLSAHAAMARPTAGRLAAVAITTALLLWTHYWAFWFLGVAGLLLLAAAARRARTGRRGAARAPLKVAGAVVVGGLTFLPWLPNLLYQSRHTGTPWARPMRPTEMVATMVADFGGGPSGEAVVLGWFLAMLTLVGLMARAAGPFTMEVDLRTRVAGRVPAALAVGTLVVACVAGYATGAAFASRYTAVIHPFVLILAAMGLAQLQPRLLGAIALSVVVVLGGAGMARNVVTERSDARRNAEAIEARVEPGDLVVYCPDQLGPAGSRALDAPVEQVTYPAFGAPERVDWVDYQDRIDRTSPEGFGEELLERAEDRSIFLVYSTGYDTHATICPDLFNVIGRQRVPEVLTHATEAYEAAGVVRFAASPG